MGHPKQKWLPLFEGFIKELRIQSKEVATLDPRGAPLDLWGSQRIALESLCEGMDRGIRSFMFLKARQLGISTVFLSVDLFFLAINPGTIGALVTESETNRNIFRETIERYVASFPPNYFGKGFTIKRANKDFVLFSNNSRLDFIVAGTSQKKNWGEGRGYSLAHLTEVASYGSAEGLAGFRETLAEKNPNRLFIYESPLALDTPIPTPGGWKTMGEIKEGNIVFNDEGVPCRVIGVSPVLLNKKCYKITFENNDSIVSDENHLWRVEERRYPTNQQWKTKTLPTKELNPDKHRIFLTKPLQLPESPLPIDPYFLGAWLGDGLSGQSAMVAGDEDMEEMRENIAAGGCSVGPISKNNWRVGKFTVLGERKKFVRLGLFGNKHIPVAYLRASEGQRRELLAGLMDTDGYINRKNFQCDFTSISTELLNGVEELLASLGIKYKKSKHAMSDKVRDFPNGRSYLCSPSWRLNFCEWPQNVVFKLKRKKDIHSCDRGYTWRRAKYLRITSIEEVPSVPVKCISVDTPSHLFLAGKTMIPTHNTAKGFNHYRDLWIEFGNDEYTKKRTFIGWWSKEINEIPKSDPRWRAYGVAPPGPEERELIEKVQMDYNFTVTQPKLAWYRWRHSDEASNEATLHQNLPWTADQAFVMSGHSFFQTRVIQKDLERCLGQPFKAYRYWLGNDFWSGKMEEIWEPERISEVQLRVWEEPDPDGMYVIGLDPAYGRNDNKDRHALCVLRCYADKLIQVAEYADNNVETRQAAWVLAHIAGAYRNCIINVEITGPGGVILTEIEHLREIMRLNAEFDEKTKKNENWEDFLGNARWYIYNKPDSFGPGHVKCWETSWKTKFQFMNQVRDNYSTGIIEVNSCPLLEEMMIVVQDGSSIGAPNNSKDDRVFALALANRIWIDHLRIGMIARRETYAEMMLQKTEGVDIKGKMVSNIVGNFFKTAEQIAIEGDDDTPQWMRDRGFV